MVSIPCYTLNKQSDSREIHSGKIETSRTCGGWNKWFTLKENTLIAAAKSWGITKISNKLTKNTRWWSINFQDKYTRNTGDQNKYKEIRKLVNIIIKKVKENAGERIRSCYILTWNNLQWKIKQIEKAIS